MTYQFTIKAQAWAPAHIKWRKGVSIEQIWCAGHTHATEDHSATKVIEQLNFEQLCTPMVAIDGERSER